ncbi:MAG: hypothetical protein B5M53_05825 [Candidatus Cloacimonas sp. 4484_209]|nr:MAG: hypothetical protein B5M53_05825 [Candidatus Cloacimonas sp. 4484_209]
MEEKRSWGGLLFVLGIALLIGGYWFLGLLPIRFDTNVIDRIFLYLGIFAGIIISIIGYLSYPHVHNLKIYLAGYLVGLNVFAFFLLGPAGIILPLRVSYFVPGLYIVMMSVLFICAVVPTFLRYRYTKFITITAIFIEGIIIYLMRFTNIFSPLVVSFRNLGGLQWFNMIPALFMLLVLLLTLLVMKLSFYLGGTLSGTIMLLVGGWYLRTQSFATSLFDSYIFAITPLFFGTGTLIHWISRMEHRAYYDSLLKVYNRSYCERVLKEQTRLNTLPPFGIAIIDVDHFKKINDTYGHRAGDEMLLYIARVLRNELVPDGIVCRYGGDEFVIFFPGKNSEKIKPLLEKIRYTTNTTFVRSGKRKIRVSLSIGVSYRKDISQGLEEVLKAADRALYNAKKQGRNQVRTHKVTTH